MVRRCVIALISLTVAAGVAGCYESPHVTLATGGSGHYNGPTDPLLAKLETKKLRGQLRARFNDAESGR